VDSRDPTNIKCYPKTGRENETYCYDDGIFLDPVIGSYGRNCSLCDYGCKACIGAGAYNCTSCKYQTPYLMTTSDKPNIGYCDKNCFRETGMKDETDMVNLKCYVNKKCRPGQFTYQNDGFCYGILIVDNA